MKHMGPSVSVGYFIIFLACNLQMHCCVDIKQQVGNTRVYNLNGHYRNALFQKDPSDVPNDVESLSECVHLEVSCWSIFLS